MQAWTGPLKNGLQRSTTRIISPRGSSVRTFSDKSCRFNPAEIIASKNARSGNVQHGRASLWFALSTTDKSGQWSRRAFSTSTVDFSNQKSSNGVDELDNTDPHAEEQEREHCFTSMRERDVMERLDAQAHMSLDDVSSSCMQATEMPSTSTPDSAGFDGVQYNSTGGVSLSGVMQSNVPEPFQSSVRGTPTHMNMPGGGTTRQDKYLAGHIKDVHPSRQFSTSARTKQPEWEGETDTESLYTPYSDMQGLQGDIGPSVSQLVHLENPCPQGVQGEDCANFKLWLNNCIRYGLSDCNDNLAAFRAGRKSLPQIFAEQERLIQEAAQRYRLAAQQTRQYSTSPRQSPDSKPEADTVSSDTEVKQLSQKDRLKRAVKDYGGTVVVFHVTISLMSLGAAYLAVSSGLDVVGLMEKLGVGKSILESRLATGTSTFVVAYAVHKVFAPVRIATTLTATPFIVQHLRRIGFLKPPKVKAS